MLAVELDAPGFEEVEEGLGCVVEGEEWGPEEGTWVGTICASPEVGEEEQGRRISSRR